MVAALAAASLLTIAVFGWTLFTRYFTANPVVKHMPASLYTEDINQSLLAAVLRVTSADLSRTSPFGHPLFLGIASLLALASAFLIFRRRTQEDDVSLALISVLGLLLFPKTLAHYAVLMLPALFCAWKIRLRFPGGPWAAGVFSSAVFGLVGARQAFWGFALGWTMFVAVMVRDQLRPRAA